MVHGELEDVRSGLVPCGVEVVAASGDVVDVEVGYEQSFLVDERPGDDVTERVEMTLAPRQMMASGSG